MLIIFSLPALSNKAMQRLEYPPVVLEGTYDIGIVLTGMTEGGISYPGHTHFSESADRLIEAVKLYQAGKIQRILISGGAASIYFKGANEGEALKEVLLAMGIPRADILHENRSRNTYENARYTAQMMKGNENYVLITSSFHMKRASACFKKQQVVFQPYPVDFRYRNKGSLQDFIPSANSFANWNTILKEYIGLQVYKIMGYA